MPLKRVLAFLLLPCTIIWGINYYVDSYHSFRLTYENLGRLQASNNVMYGSEIPSSERKIKWAVVKAMEQKEFIVLGSSRSLMFSGEDFACDRFYNFAVSGGATIEDYYSEVYLLILYDKFYIYRSVYFYRACAVCK